MDGERKRIYPVRSKEPRPQGGALKPKFLKPRPEIPKQVRDDKKGNSNPVVMLNSFQHLVKIFSAFGRHTFHPRPCLPAGRHRTGLSGAILIMPRWHF